MTYYKGAEVSSTFMARWRSRKHVGSARPWAEVSVRRGRLLRSYHDDWPDPQFGRIVGRSIRHQWYPDWTPLDDWSVLPGVYKIDLDQSFDKNGLTVATIEADNVAWVNATGFGGAPYHKRERGYLWPWRGWVPANRPGSGDAQNQWFDYLPNVQVLVRQGYGSDTAVKTFTGLVDSLAGNARPDRLTLTCRDFGGVLSDCDLFGWNKDKQVNDPITFIPHDDERLAWANADGKPHRWIVIKDSVEIVKCMLRWAGFKEWQIEDSGVNLSTPMTVDKGMTYMDVIKAVGAQLGYVFLLGEPSDDDLSIGVPIFRPATVLIPQRSAPILIRDKDLLTDIQPQHDNTNDRYIIRVRGVVNKKIGRTLGGDTFKRVNFAYWPPWIKYMSGVIKQVTYYNIGDKGTLGFATVQQCAVACVLIAVQISLTRWTATAQTAGNPALGLDSFAFVTDAGTGIASRLYITNRKSTMTLGGDGTGAVDSSSSNELLWATEIGGSLCDNPEWDHIILDYQKAISGQKVISWGPVGWD